ncbi:UNVERIFIED_CONTAM: hypothetical protein Slati_0878500 [Sesamum latifolium]|uniref:DUF4283 domain-containing protein n=1 Tax=Sesamum latifolium TaxID=2727402 RepID=A0AAW2XP85_9LAMI
MGSDTSSKEVQVVSTPSRAGLSLAQHNHVDSVQQPISVDTLRRAPTTENPNSDAEFDSGGSLAVSKPSLAGYSSTPYVLSSCLMGLNPNPNLKGADVFDTIHGAPTAAGLLEDLIVGAKSDMVPTAAAASHAEWSMGIFIGKVPLRADAPPLQSESRFADAFNNSSRKTLRFVPPDNQNGEVIVRPTLAMIRDGSKKWEATAVGYFLGRKPPFHQVSTYVQSVWPCVKDVIATSNAFFFVQFNTCAVMEEVIEGGSWLFQGRPIVLQKWEPGMALRKHAHTQVPIWIKLHHLPVELWTTDGLSTIASGVDKHLYPDAITKAGTRLAFARVLGANESWSLPHPFKRSSTLRISGLQSAAVSLEDISGSPRISFEARPFCKYRQAISKKLRRVHLRSTEQ